MNPNNNTARGKASGSGLSEGKIINKTFFRFLFSFVAVIAGVLLFILVLGVGSGVQ